MYTHTTKERLTKTPQKLGVNSGAPDGQKKSLKIQCNQRRIY